MTQKSYQQQPTHLNHILLKNGHNLTLAKKFQVAWSDNWGRFMASSIIAYVCVFLLCYLTISLLGQETNKNTAFISLFFALPITFMPIAMSPDALMFGESFLFKWKAKRLKSHFMKQFHIQLNKNALKKDEVQVYYSLLEMLKQLSSLYQLDKLKDNEEFWKDWRHDFQKMTAVHGWLKYMFYANENYLDKNFTEISYNDMIDVFKSEQDFSRQLEKIMVNRKYSIREVQKLLNKFFIAIQVAEIAQNPKINDLNPITENFKTKKANSFK